MPEEQCDIRTVFQRDRDRVIHCKAFRLPEGQDTGFSDSGRRSLPDTPDSYAGGISKCPHDCQSAFT